MEREPKHYIVGEGVVKRFDGDIEPITIIATNMVEIKIMEKIIDRIIALDVNDHRLN